MQTDYDSIAFALREDNDIIKSVINDFDLFVLDGNFFYSKSLFERMKLKEEQSEKARESAKKRWNKPKDAKAMRTHSDGNANPMQLKESKVKEIKVNELTIDSVRDSFSKQGINSLPHFHSIAKAFRLNPSKIEEHFEKWALASIDSMKDLSHCKRSFNLYLENIKNNDLDDQNLPSVKYGKSPFKNNGF